MKLLKVNLKILYKSIWFIIQFCAATAISLLLLFVGDSNGHSGMYAYDCLTVNIFLGVLIPVISVYAVQITDEIEYSLVGRARLIITKYTAVNIFVISSETVPLFLLTILSVVKGVAANLILQYIFCIICVTVSQCLFLSAVSFAFALMIKNKNAYFVSILTTFIFSPFIRDIANNYNGMIHNLPFADTIYALYDLICLSYDDMHRFKYMAYGMTLNIEALLSWIIAILSALFILMIVLLLSKCFKKTKKKKIYAILSGIAILSLCTVNVFMYFSYSPVEYIYDNLEQSPSKIDIIDVYNEDYKTNSAIVKEYDMDLKTGTIVCNKCKMKVDTNETERLRLKLDECFNINCVLLNNETINFERDNDSFYINVPANSTVDVEIEYSGRMNTVDFCATRWISAILKAEILLRCSHGIRKLFLKKTLK